MPDARPIGLFDSGVGGLTVLREVMRRLPSESTIYLGDNARAPYGPRQDDEVIRYSSECLDHLAGLDVKAIVVACNTASAVALPELRRRARVPVLGVVRPGATAAALATRSGRVGVIATQATVRSHAYSAAISDEDPAVIVHEHATPELVPLVESGRTSGPEVLAVVRRSLAALLPVDGYGPEEGDGSGVDTLLLGCTHYPLLVDVIASVVGPSVAVIDFGVRDGVVAGRTAGGPRHRRARAAASRRMCSSPPATWPPFDGPRRGCSEKSSPTSRASRSRSPDWPRGQSRWRWPADGRRGGGLMAGAAR